MQYNLNVMSKSVEIKVREHHATYLHGISEVRKDKRFFDIKLCVGDKEIDSHKAVLAAFSPYFSDYFDDAFLNSGQDRIDLSDNTNMAVLTSILDYMYSGSISFLIEDGAMLMRTLDFFKMQSVKDICETSLVNNIDTENYVDFFNLADGAMLMRTLDLFKMRSVKDLCEAYIVDNVDAENFVAVFNLGEEVSLESLKEAAVDYITTNFREIYGSDEIKKLTKDQLESVVQKTCEEDAEITCEAIIRWIKYDTLNRKDYVEQLLKYVSIKHIPASYYWEYIGKEDFLKNDVGGRRWLVSSFLDLESPLRQYQTLHISTSDNSYYKWDVREKLLTTLESPPKLNGCAMVKYHDSIYAFGEGDENEIGGIGLKYDTTTKWTRVVAGNILIKHSPGICSHGDGIYLIGGEENNQRQRTCIRYDVETSQWTTLPEMQIPRSSPGVVFCNSSIYVFGGYKNKLPNRMTEGLTRVERYDPREGKWFEQSYVKLESSISSAVVSEYNVCCLQCNSDNVINFDTRSSDDTNVTSNVGTSLASLDGRLYIAHEEGIAEYNPYAMKWNEILQKSLNCPFLIA